MFGHVLRMPNEVPAKFMTKHYFDPREKSFLGRPRTTLPILLDKDLKTAKAQPHHNYEQLNLPKQLQTLSELEQLEILANERSLWQTIVANMQVPPPPKQTKMTLRPRRNV